MDLVYLIPIIIAAYLSGIGTSHISLMRKVNRMAEKIVGLDRDVKANSKRITEGEKRSIRSIDELKEMAIGCHKMHTESLGVFGKIIDQNSILIHRLPGMNES